jgi:hypothetical protein
MPTLSSNLRLEGGAAILSWDFLAAKWSSPPAEVGTATVSGQSGVVLSFVLDGVTRYRFVPDTYSPVLDGFYSTYSGGVLSGLITSRG